MPAKILDFSHTKTIVERQILNTLDFLFTDNQITEVEVIQISRYVLNNIETALTKAEFFRQLRQFVNKYPLFKNSLQKTVIALNNSYVG